MDTSYYKRPPWRQARWIIAAAVIAVLAATTAIVLTAGGSTSRRTTTQAGAAACPATAESSAIPAAPPADLQWKNINSFVVPTSATYGPFRASGAVWQCYPHNPMGAVMVAYDIEAGLGSPQWDAWAKQDAEPGQGQQAFIAASKSQAYQAPAPGEIAQAVGFEVISYTPQQATVEALADGGENYFANELTVTWYSGDWKMVLTPDGSTGPTPQFVTSTDGFTLWGGAGNEAVPT
jgi:hypothetical protein